MAQSKFVIVSKVKYSKGFILELKSFSNALAGPITFRPDGDYSVHGDYSGYPQIVVFVGNLKCCGRQSFCELQRLIKEFPGWQVEVTVAVRGHDWPNMGLYIRPHEIIDGLQRQYFPKEFQDIAYEGARRGTAYD